MRAKEISKYLRKEPFQAFGIFVSDGSHYDIRHPEMVLVTQTVVAIALDPGNGDVPEEMAYCDPLHITRIEPLKGRRTVRRSRTKR